MVNYIQFLGSTFVKGIKHEPFHPYVESNKKEVPDKKEVHEDGKGFYYLGRTIRLGGSGVTTALDLVFQALCCLGGASVIGCSLLELGCRYIIRQTAPVEDTVISKVFGGVLEQIVGFEKELVRQELDFFLNDVGLAKRFKNPKKERGKAKIELYKPLIEMFVSRINNKLNLKKRYKFDY